jgi:group I intron endonuclease
MTSGVYLIRCKPTGKVYVGSSKNMEKRWTQHRVLLNRNQHHSFKLQSAWNKYGENAFQFEIVEEVIGGFVTVVEQAYINSFDSFVNGFNCAKLAGAGAGRPPKPNGKSVWIPEEIRDLVIALKQGDVGRATLYFARWLTHQAKVQGLRVNESR